MGARYAPSVANLVLHKWQHETINQQEWTELKIYKLYIDDIFVLWKGS